MALEATVTEEQLGEMNEAIKEHYVAQEDGTYLLDVPQNESGYGIGNIKNMMSAKTFEKAERQKIANQYKWAEGMDSDQVTAALDFHTNYQDKNINHQEEMQKAKESMSESFKKQLGEEQAKWQEDRGKLVSKLTTSEIDNFIRTELTGIVADPEDVEALLPHYKQRMRLNDEYAPTVLDSYGEEMIPADNNVRSAMKVLHKEMKGKFPKSFKSEIRPGSGGGSAQTGSAVAGLQEMKLSEFEKMNPDQRQAFLFDKDGKRRPDVRLEND